MVVDFVSEFGVEVAERIIRKRGEMDHRIEPG
jgi:hypothetical protein